MISEATVMSKPVSRVRPFSAGPCPTVMLRRERSQVSTTRCHVMVSCDPRRAQAPACVGRGRPGRGAVAAHRVDVEPHKPADLLLRKVLHALVGEAEALQASLEGRGDAVGAVGVGGAEATQQGLVGLRGLVEHARVQLGGEQVVGSRDGVDVAGEVEVEGLHGDDLGVPAAGGAALDAECGTLSDERRELAHEWRVAHRGPSPRGGRRRGGERAHLTGLANAREHLAPRPRPGERSAARGARGGDASTFLPRCAPRAWLRPTVVVLLPSPSGVGVMAVTTT